MKRANLCWAVVSLLSVSALVSCNHADSTNTASAVAWALPDHTAGAACETAQDCKVGSCLSWLPSLLPFGSESRSKAVGGYCSLPCLRDTECGAGGACYKPAVKADDAASAEVERGLCYAMCDRDSDCRAGYRCLLDFGIPLDSEHPTEDRRGVCSWGLASEPLSADVAGNACEHDAECSNGYCLKSRTYVFDVGQRTNFTGGYCSGSCLNTVECGEHGTCVFDQRFAPSCFRSCEDDADCEREGYRCRARLDGRVEGPAPLSKQCFPGTPPLPDNVVGNACTNDADCGGISQSCVRSQFDGRKQYPAGYCSNKCAESADCGAGGVCEGGFNPALGEGMCFKPCEDDGDCREGYACQPVLMTVGRLVCVPLENDR